MLRRLRHAFVAAVLVLPWIGSAAHAQPATPAATLTLPARPAAARPALAPPPVATAPWVADLDRRVRAIDARFAGDLGVHVQRLGDGARYGFRADEVWYLASGVKVPIAIAVMREIEQGWLTLDTQVTLLADDIVDGAGRTNAHRPGDRRDRAAGCLGESG